MYSIWAKLPNQDVERTVARSRLLLAGLFPRMVVWSADAARSSAPKRAAVTRVAATNPGDVAR
jgi:hypothetical protein